MSVPDYSYSLKIPCAPGKQRQQAALQLDKPTVLTPNSAFRILNKLTHGSVARSTFYRWLSNGKVFSYRVGYHLYIPMSEIEAIVKQCQDGKWS